MRMKKIKFFSQETNNFQILENERLMVAGYEKVKVGCKVMALKNRMIYAQIVIDIHWNSFILKFKTSTK